LALKIREIMENTAGVVDVDWFMEGDQTRYDLQIDQERAALHGISVAHINEVLKITLTGKQAGLLHQPLEKEDVPIRLRPPLELRAGLDRLQALKIPSSDGRLVPLSSLIKIRKTDVDRSIYHKNLMPVVYVVGDVAGARESPVYAILEMRKKINEISIPEGYRLEQHTAALPESDRRFAMKWDGEWHITYEVFRDLGLAFGVVLVLIFVLVVGWFQSFSTPFTIMVAIPFSLIGILPAHCHFNDRLYRRRGDRGAQFHHSGGFYRAAVAAGHALGPRRYRCRRRSLQAHDADGRGGGGGRFGHPF
jgi:multidrug efflux pump subunit AcrB